MNLKKKVQNLQDKLLNWIDDGWTLRPIRIFVSELMLSILAIAYLTEHMKMLSDLGTIIFASFFVGLVLYFKNKQ